MDIIRVIELITAVLGSSLLTAITSALMNKNKVKAEADSIVGDLASKWLLEADKKYDKLKELYDDLNILFLDYKKETMEKELEAQLELSKMHREISALYSIIKNDERFRTLYENMYHSVITIKYSNGMIVDANSRACELFLYTVDEFKKKNKKDIFIEHEKIRLYNLKGTTKIDYINCIKSSGEIFIANVLLLYYEDYDGIYKFAIIDPYPIDEDKELQWPA